VKLTDEVIIDIMQIFEYSIDIISCVE